ncbi:MAG: patatin-like phospholipase family protein [Gammaproteobacteria bacterium]|nr:patatin-like phospholipase family protein [Gammaproteobacteria bacterium]
MTDAFHLAQEQLREIAEASDGSVLLHDQREGSANYDLFDLSIRFDGLEKVDEGLRVRARERFRIYVPRSFPFEHPVVHTLHTRFAGFHHVQWRRQLCLYASAADWRPEAGMYGFIRRLDAWIRDAALNKLDPDDAPLHPPVAYSSVDHLIVPRANTPVVTGSPWFGIAELRSQNGRTEIVGWGEPDEQRPELFAPAILLQESLPFEYPSTVKALLDELESHGIEYAPFVWQLARHALESGAQHPLLVVLGTPMRRVSPGGPSLQHLAVWQVSREDANKLRTMLAASTLGVKEEKETAIREVVEWSISAEVGWCKVHEMRPEVTNRRDKSSAMAWFQGKSVAIWGCGAIGTHVAESVVRAGVSRVELADKSTVGPGILVRQNFEDADIGTPKALALAERLQRIEPNVTTCVSTENLILRITGESPFPNVDLIIDCTASLAVRTAMEYALQDIELRPAIASIAVDGVAQSGLATFSTPRHSGGSLDLIRRLKLEACRKPKLSNLLEAFWSEKRERFQPEPGCSEPTFVGSDADLAGLSSRALNAVAHAAATLGKQHTGAGWLFEARGSIHAFKWAPDHTLCGGGQKYSVRVSPLAMREMRGWARRSARTVGKEIETGGLIFGEINDAVSVLWVTEVEGPPPDSDATEHHFTCGIEGMAEASEEKRSRFRGSVACIGSWHTHPSSTPHPSNIDLGAVLQLIGVPDSTRKTCLLLILSGSPDNPELGVHTFRRKRSDEKVIHLEQNTNSTLRLGSEQSKTANLGLALSGGGSRAIAFHLGCFRALHDLRLLDRVQVVSSVSGGSVIGGIYAYGSNSFEEFDERVTKLLKRGLHWDIIFRTLSPKSIWRVLLNGAAASAISIVRLLQQLVRAATRTRVPLRLTPPPLRSYSRTEAFREVIARKLFGETLVRDVKRASLDTVINATDLRTGSAFRFGSKQSGCWRFGKIKPEDAFVADAVAASAAYPIFLPALDRRYQFTRNDGATVLERVLLSDGGVYENLGVSPMEPGRTPSFSTNVFDPDYIISCDAGAGLFDDQSFSLRWPGRMERSFSTVFRKVQDATRKRLHQFADSGDISGFALCYLGQQDRALPWIPGNLPKREEVRDYPTNFAAMSLEDIKRLALRGELLMRLLIAYYLPDL